MRAFAGNGGGIVYRWSSVVWLIAPGMTLAGAIRMSFLPVGSVRSARYVRKSRANALLLQHHELSIPVLDCNRVKSVSITPSCGADPSAGPG